MIMTAYVVICYGVMSTSDKEPNIPNKQWKMAIKNLVNSMFILFLLAYSIALSLLITRLKSRVPEYYKVQKK